MAEPQSAREDLAVRRRRLRYRAWHRGMREMDLILGAWCEARLDFLAETELDRLERLLEEPDTDLMRWVLGLEEPPPHIDRDMILSISNFRSPGAAR